jgi:uncharacterized membrane protein
MPTMETRMNKTIEDLASRWLKRRAEGLSTLESRVLKSTIDRTTITRDTNKAVALHQSFGDRVADAIARFGGSWVFILGFLAFLFVWTVANAFMLGQKSFDPYPFIFLNLVLSMLAALQAPIIMMAQNRQAERDRIDAAHDYEVNLKAEIEIMALHEKVDEMRRAQPDAATGSAPDMRRDLAMIAERLGRIEERLLTARWTSGH